MASKKSEDTKKRAPTKVATAKRAAPAKKAVPVKKAAAAKKAAPTSRRKVSAPPGQETQDCCVKLTRQVESLRKELREALRALRSQVAQPTPAAKGSGGTGESGSLNLTGIAGFQTGDGTVTFTLPDATHLTLSQMADGGGRIVLDLRPGAVVENPEDFAAAMAQLFGFLSQNSSYLKEIGVAATCGYCPPLK